MVLGAIPSSFSSYANNYAKPYFGYLNREEFSRLAQVYHQNSSSMPMEHFLHFF